jgi:hypothetical protein
MLDPYPPLRRKQIRKQEPKPYVPSDYDGAEGSEPIEVTEE